MPKIAFRGEITDFHPTKSKTVKLTIEADLDEETAKMMWLIEKGVDIIITDNQTTLET